MDFNKKNDLIVKHKNEKFFEQDLKLFNERCKNSQLHADLKRVNSFNKVILAGQMLFELLDKVSIEEILENRKKTIEAVSKEVDVEKKLEELKLKEAELEKREAEIEKREAELEKKEADLAERVKLLSCVSNIETKAVELEDKEAELEEKAKEVKTASKKKASTKSSPE